MTASFKKTIATAEAKIADAEAKAFMARLDAIDAIMLGATPYDVMRLAAHVLAAAVPNCCEVHQDEFKADFLQMLNDCAAEQQRERDAVDAADDDDDAHTSVH